MTRRNRLPNKIALLIASFLTILLVSLPGHASAQAEWPPLQVRLSPRHESQKIIYDISIRRLVDWEFNDITLKIPVPNGTRFVETQVQPGLEADFDGQEITFFISYLDQTNYHASFTVEISDLQSTTFVTQAWFSWQGSYPGDYLADPVSINLNQQFLSWRSPQFPFQLSMTATVTDNIVTYRLYPKVIDPRRRIWDVSIKVPIPAGANFLATEATSSFTANSDGQEISFFSREFRPEDEASGPLIIRVSSPSDSVVTTHAWVTWKNAGPGVGTRIASQEELVTGDLWVKSGLKQTALSDATGDTPFANYDLTSLTLQETGSALIVNFHTVGDIGPIGQPLTFNLFIDRDCNNTTGELKQGRGVEYQLQYNHHSGQAAFVLWEQSQNHWLWDQSTRLESSAGQQSVVVSIPRDLFSTDQPFCWVGRSINGDPAFYPSPPGDWLPIEAYTSLTTYQFELPQVSSPTASLPDPVTPQTPDSSSPLENITGKLAVPIINKSDFYDVHIFSLPAGEEITQIQNARQPNFGPDGSKLLINRQRGYIKVQKPNSGNQAAYLIEYRDAVENIAEFDFNDERLRQVSRTSQGAYPDYNPQGDHTLYERSTLTVGPNGPQQRFSLMQCSLASIPLESGQQCQTLFNFEQIDSNEDSIGYNSSYPLWASNETLIFRRCTNLAGSLTCGIYASNLADGQSISRGDNAVPLNEDPTAIPSDTYGEWITYTSRQDGNWEAYVMSLDGTIIRNLSENAAFNDGLPTISPDGEWVAFVSDRSGEWAVWIVPITGGPSQKLFNLPAWAPWGNDGMAWINERITWGP